MTEHKNLARPIYVVRFSAVPGRDGIRGLKAILKSALRRHGLRALSAYEEKIPQEPPPEQHHFPEPPRE